MRMRQSLAEFEQAFVEETHAGPLSGASALHAMPRSARASADSSATHKRGSMRFVAAGARADRAPRSS